MDDFRDSDGVATSWLNLVRNRVGDNAWLFEEAGGYEKFSQEGAIPVGGEILRQAPGRLERRRMHATITSDVAPILSKNW